MFPHYVFLAQNAMSEYHPRRERSWMLTLSMEFFVEWKGIPKHIASGFLKSTNLSPLGMLLYEKSYSSSLIDHDDPPAPSEGVPSSIPTSTDDSSTVNDSPTVEPVLPTPNVLVRNHLRNHIQTQMSHANLALLVHLGNEGKQRTKPRQTRMTPILCPTLPFLPTESKQMMIMNHHPSKRLSNLQMLTNGGKQ